MKVSVLMITYNHERFIGQAIEGVLMQQTDFPYELVIGEDCSTDGTRKIVVEYTQKYPDRIRALLPERNLGMQENGRRTREACRGEYIALCEGDDYWTDPHKLQKQVEFLQAHTDYVVCHHDAFIIDEHGTTVAESKLPAGLKRDFSAEELIRGTWVLTLTACFRNVLRDYPAEGRKVHNGDAFLFSLLGNYGSSKYMGHSISPAAYRVHSGGVWSAIGDDHTRSLHNLITYYWLRRYYERIEKMDYARHHAVRMPHAEAMCRASSPERLHAELRRHLGVLESEGITRNTTGEEEVSVRASVSANLYMGAALASFALHEWRQGRTYLQDAIRLDPGVWCDPAVLERLFTEQAPKTLAAQHRQRSSWAHDYVAGTLSCLGDAIPLSRTTLRRIKGSMYAESAYLSYLADDQRGVRDLTCSALRAWPLLVRDVGMLKRAFSI